MAKKYINGVENAPEPGGPYSQAVISGSLVFLSGQIPINPKTGELVEGGIEEQTNQVLKNLIAVLGHMQLDLTDVLKTTVYLTDLKEFQVMNSVYSKWFNQVKPARSCVQVASLPRGSRIEIDLIANLSSPDVVMMPMPSVEEIDEMTDNSYTVSKEAETEN
jgi:2-iminobutanoate/2-iminopropanoate deaminase